MDLKHLYKKYLSIVLYLFFGICTTIVNVFAYWLFSRSLKMDILPSAIISWFLAVLFAYITNRKWVFRSDAKKHETILKEMISFFSCRLTTGVIDWLCMICFVNILAWNDMIVKSATNVLVIFLNYVASKLIIFREER